LPETVTLKNIPACTVAYKSGKGPYSLISEAVRDLNLWIRENGHTAAGPPVGVFKNNPFMPPEELLWEVQVPLKLDGPLSVPETDTTPGLKDVPDRQVMAAHQGDLDTLGEALQGLIRFMVSSGYRMTAAPEQVFLKDPVTTPPHELEGELRLTVEKREKE